MIELRPGSTLREGAVWWTSRARTARLDLTGVTLDIIESSLPFVVTVIKIVQPATRDFEIRAPASETSKAAIGTVGHIRIRATFANGDEERLPDVPVTLS